MDSISARSPAKINLTLRVFPRRDDGYHDIESLVAKVWLYDEITIHRREDDRLTLKCDDRSIPSDETNLALRAARKLAEASGGVECGVHIVLRKKIPAGAGLGGGSSNAATVLKLLNDFWRLGIARDDLAKFGASLGSDVPLFLYGPLCVIRGRGERVEEVSRPLPPWCVLILPRIHSATGDVYAAFDRLPPPPERPSVAEILSAREIEPLLFNDLTAAARIAHPVLDAFGTMLERRTLERTHLTGSGAAWFCLCGSKPDARLLANAIRSATGPAIQVVPLLARVTA